ncbi:MAG: hypothetical protein IJ662_06555 [Clostridia bacterium]|nr:hypothetical protein [Clostridia bacterium]
MAEHDLSIMQPQQAQLAHAVPAGAQMAGDQETQIDLLELLYRILASWKMIACIVIVCMIAAAFYSTSYVTPLYQATSSIYVIGRDSAINLSDLQLGSNMMSDYLKVFEMWEVHDEVIKNLKLDYSYAEIEKHISVSNSTGTHILDITFSSPDPQEASAAANEYANVVSNYIADTMRMDKPSVMSVALTPTNPYNISRTRSIALGFVLGLVIGCGIVVIRFIMDDKVKTVEDVRKYTGLVNLAIVPVEESVKATAHSNNNKKKGRK